MIWYLIYAAVWMLGFFASVGAMARIGERNPETIGESFTGDDLLDLIVAALWPVTWPCFAAYRFGKCRW